MELEVKKPIEIEEGKHSGEITKVEYRTEPFDYTDVYIRPDNNEFEIAYGCPTHVSESSKLGRLLAVFTELKVGSKIDPEKILLNKRIKFLVQKKKAKDGKEYARVVEDSIKPEIQTVKMNK